MKINDAHILEGSQRELAAAILKQAARDLRPFHKADTEIERELYFDAYTWVMSHDSSWPFSFQNVCRLLGRAPRNVQEELLGDLPLGMFSQLARRCSRAADRLQRLLVRQFSYR